MSQQSAWEQEYQHPRLVVFGEDPQKDTRTFLKYLRKVKKTEVENLDVLDLGSGVGKNANYLASLGNRVVGLEFSPTAVKEAIRRRDEAALSVEYRVHNIGEPYPFANESFDLVLDVMTSNSLNEHERSVYLSEVARVLRSGGHFFFRGLCKDGDANAKVLIKTHPGKEHDTYIHEAMGLTERVFTEEDFRTLYGKYFCIRSLEKKTNYQRFGDRTFKRNYWIGYLQKPE